MVKCLFTAKGPDLIIVTMRQINNKPFIEGLCINYKNR